MDECSLLLLKAGRQTDDQAHTQRDELSENESQLDLPNLIQGLHSDGSRQRCSGFTGSPPETEK